MQVVLSFLAALGLAGGFFSMASGEAVTEAAVEKYKLPSPPAQIKIKVEWPELIAEKDMPGNNILKLALVGDIMMGTTFPEVRLPSDDGAHLFRDSKEILSRADIAAGNLEGVLGDTGESRKKVVEGRSYAFRTPLSYTRWLSEAGFDFLSLANNHSRDFGDEGLASTKAALDSAGIGYAGLPDCRYALKNVKGYVIGFCAFGHNSHTLRHTETSSVENLIRELRDSCDILIVSFHGGAEGAAYSHLPHGREEFLGENRGNLRAFARLCIDLGADVVFGHGPHVTRAVELYRNRFIAYSLGNFCTPFGMNISEVNGYAPILELSLRSDGSFRAGKIHSLIQYPGTGPRSTSSGVVAAHISALTASDIEDSGLEFGPDGVLIPISELPVNELLTRENTSETQPYLTL